MTSNLADQTLQQVADRQAITDLIYRYCRSMDRADAPLGYSVWHPDGTADYSAQFFQGTGHDYIDWVCAHHLEFFTSHSHQVTNVIIGLDGDTASSEAYVTIVLRHTDGDRLLETTVRGRYIDWWSRREGRWGIDRRVYLHDIDDIREIAARAIEEVRGHRDRSDLSYEALEP